MTSVFRVCARASVAVFFLGAELLGSGSARAEDAEIRTAARDLATQGAEAFEAGRYADASDFFRRAHELVPAPTIALLEARSLAKLALLLEAADVYEQTAHVKLADDAPAAYAQAIETARLEVEEVRKRVPRLKLSVTGAASGEFAQVSMDDKPTPPALLGVERPVNPGLHRIVVYVAGELRISRDLSLTEGEAYQIELDIKRVEKAPQPTPVAKRAYVASTPHANVVAASPLKTFGYVALGVGAVGLGLGTYTGIVALHHKSTLDAACDPRCPSSYANDLDGFRSNRTLSWASYAVGVAAVATGVVLLTLGKPSGEQLAIHAVSNGLRIGGQF